MATRTKEFRTQIAAQFLEVLEKEQLNWKKEWQGIHTQMNGTTQHIYRGINQFYLHLVSASRGYQDPRWLTFHQIKEQGWHLENAKGQGVKVEYWFPYDTKEKKNLSWTVFRALDESLGDRYILRATYSTVFNGDLIQGIPPFSPPENREIQPDVLIEALSKNMGVPILHDGEDQAFYRPGEDTIHLPRPEQFISEYAYNATALHELGHATGAPHRLNRALGGMFGSEEYAFEELVAEMTSCFLSAEIGDIMAENHLENHQAYIQNWINHIREKPDTLIRAIQQAEKATSYMEYKGEMITKEEYERMAGITFEAKENQVENVAENNAEKVQKNQGNTGQTIQRMQNRGEILAGMNEISEMLKEVKADTSYFKEFIEKWKLEAPGPELSEGDRYQALEGNKGAPATEYVILDTETGELLPQHYEAWEPAQQEAEWLNWKNHHPEESIQKEAFQMVRSYERSIGRGKSSLEYMPTAAQERYVADCKRYLQFGATIDSYLAGEMDPRDAVYVCETPKLFLEAGCQPLPMHITQRHLRQCIHPEEPGHPEYHGLTREQIKGLPEYLEAPAMLMESLTQKDSLVAVAPRRDQKSRPIIVSVKREGYASYQLEAVPSNFITSIYGKDDFPMFLNRNIREHKLIYISTEKSKNLALVPVQFRHDHPDLCFDTIIQKIHGDVNQIGADFDMVADAGEPGLSEVQHVKPKI